MSDSGSCDLTLLVSIVGVTDRVRLRWVMSTTTHVSRLSDIPPRLTDQAKASVSVAGVSRRRSRSDRSR